jgi:phosphoesterase RecJ-like protein
MDTKKNTRIWQDTSVIERLLQSVPKQIAIITHINPDGDAIGSSLGLKRLLQNIGHHCSLVSPNDYPDFLKWLPGNEEVIIFSNAANKSISSLQQAEILFALDFNELKRTKKLDLAVAGMKAYKVLIDHHPDPEMKADCILSDTSVSSTAEIVWQFLNQMGLQRYVDKEVATCLFTGIMTDTGCFSHNSSAKETYEAVAELLSYPIDKDEIYHLIYDNFSCERMRLLGYCLNEKMEILQEYHTAMIWLTREELIRYHFKTGDSEGFVNYPLSIKGIRFSVFFQEKEDHVKISFRSKGKFAVNGFARKYFNGGGHHHASGGESYSNMEDTLKRFKDLLPLYRDELNADD